MMVEVPRPLRLEVKSLFGGLLVTLSLEAVAGGFSGSLCWDPKLGWNRTRALGGLNKFGPVRTAREKVQDPAAFLADLVSERWAGVPEEVLGGVTEAVRALDAEKGRLAAVLEVMSS